LAGTSPSERLDALADEIRAGRSLNTDDARFVARVLRTFVETPSRGRDALLRQEAIRERDAHLVALARERCSDLKEIRPKVRRILALAHRYQATAWVRERHAVACPADRLGKPEAHLWAALRAFPELPGERRLHEILTASIA